MEVFKFTKIPQLYKSFVQLSIGSGQSRNANRRFLPFPRFKSSESRPFSDYQFRHFSGIPVQHYSYLKGSERRTGRAREVTIFDSTLRDGLQGRKKFVPTAVKLGLGVRLWKSGLRSMEVVGLVNTKVMPQMRDNREVWQGLEQLVGTGNLSALVPTRRQAEIAWSLGVENFTYPGVALDEEFCLRNLGCSIKESDQRLRAIVRYLEKKGQPVTIRVYLSGGYGNPEERKTWQDCLEVAKRIMAMNSEGADQVVISNTFGGKGIKVLEELDTVLFFLRRMGFPMDRLALHVHSDGDEGLDQVGLAFKRGVITFDGSLKGIGTGCPKANVKGKSPPPGNLSTEGLTAHFENLHIRTGVNQALLAKASAYAEKKGLLSND